MVYWSLLKYIGLVAQEEAFQVDFKFFGNTCQSISSCFLSYNSCQCVSENSRCLGRLVSVMRKHCGKNTSSCFQSLLFSIHAQKLQWQKAFIFVFSMRLALVGKIYFAS